jgi:ABC-type transport system involved in multi-copper enzyme maturation permease subunit
MKWQFWKEYRQNRPIFIALAVMIVLPHLFGLAIFLIKTLIYHEKLAGDWRVLFIGTSLYSLGLSQLAFGLIGGNAIAGERADRSAEFQAYLPISSYKILQGKLLAVLTVAAAVWTINPLIILCLLGSVLLPSDINFEFVGQISAIIAITGFTFFGASWLFSSFLSSPTISVVAGLVAPIAIWSGICYVNYLVQGDVWGPNTQDVLLWCYCGIGLVVSAICFIAGTWVFLRRVEP